MDCSVIWNGPVPCVHAQYLKGAQMFYPKPALLVKPYGLRRLGRLSAILYIRRHQQAARDKKFARRAWIPMKTQTRFRTRLESQSLGQERQSNTEAFPMAQVRFRVDGGPNGNWDGRGE